MKDLFFLTLGLLIVFSSVFLFFKKPLDQENQTKIVNINNTSITVEVANTSEMRAKGLSDRRTLPDGTGMFFVFDSPDKYGFWMKNMNFSIDIIWIDADMYIVGVEKQVSPKTFPQIFYPNQAVKYVLELPAGFSDEHRIDIGQYVTI